MSQSEGASFAIHTAIQEVAKRRENAEDADILVMALEASVVALQSKETSKYALFIVTDVDSAVPDFEEDTAVQLETPKSKAKSNKERGEDATDATEESETESNEITNVPKRITMWKGRISSKRREGKESVG